MNPENEWPKIAELKNSLNNINHTVKERLPVYEKFINKKYLKEKVYEKTVKLQRQIN